MDIDWTKTPEFEFINEVHALETIEELRDDLEAARKQVGHTMRYLAAAVVAARHVHVPGDASVGFHPDRGPVSKQTIINYSGLARQTVYDILSDDKDV